MNQIRSIKEIFFRITFVTTILMLAACNEVKFDHYAMEDDALFLENAAGINLEEIQLGQLAQQKGKITQVKELGKMMEDSHTKSLFDLTSLAEDKMIFIPSYTTGNGQNAYKKLYNISSEDFDKAYADRMVNGRKKAIEAFEKASFDSKDTDIKNWAISTLHDMRTNLDHSIDCQKKFNKM